MMECFNVALCSNPRLEINVDIDFLQGTSNDSWTGGSIVSQLNPDILKKIRNCFQVGYCDMYLRIVFSVGSTLVLIICNLKTKHEHLYLVVFCVIAFSSLSRGQGKCPM